jgi:hypothetical protein
MKTYRISALASAFVRMWRGWAVIVPVVVVNAILQALLIWSDPTPGDGIAPILLAIASAIIFVVAYGLVAATALHVTSGKVGWAQAIATVKANAGGYALCVVGLLIVVAIGRALYGLPGLLVLAVTPFFLLAALDSQKNPLGTNFRTIARRPWRFVVTTVITGLVVILGSLITGFMAFFIRGSAASLLVWTISGLILAWFTTAWALIYRNAHAPVEGPATVVAETPAAALPEGDLE